MLVHLLMPYFENLQELSESKNEQKNDIINERGDGHNYKATVQAYLHFKQLRQLITVCNIERKITKIYDNKF